MGFKSVGLLRDENVGLGHGNVGLLRDENVGFLFEQRSERGIHF